MSDARAAIFGAIRTNPLRGRVISDAASIAAAAAALVAEPHLVRPKLGTSDVVAAFAAKLASGSVGASAGHAESLQAFPAAILRYIASNDLPPVVWLQPDPLLQQLDWAGLALSSVLSPDEQVGVGLARAGVAETGSLVFASGADTAVLGHFLPAHHIVGLPVANIVGYLEDIGDVATIMPRNLNLVTGPSGTTDIEGEFVLGAHGPRFLHIILIGDTHS
jgi:L-lactate dehydrogenase complex protein LldG